jgi:hypothetical protein
VGVAYRLNNNGYRFIFSYQIHSPTELEARFSDKPYMARYLHCAGYNFSFSIRRYGIFFGLENLSSVCFDLANPDGLLEITKVI